MTSSYFSEWKFHRSLYRPMLIVQVIIYVFKFHQVLIPVSTVFSVSVVSSPSMLSSSSTAVFPLLRGLQRNRYTQLKLKF